MGCHMVFVCVCVGGGGAGGRGGTLNFLGVWGKSGYFVGLWPFAFFFFFFFFFFFGGRGCY